MIQIRQAVPDDVQEVSQLIDMSGSAEKISVYELMFPGEAQTRLDNIGRLFINGERIYNHYTRYLIAEKNGEIAGTLCTFNHEYFRTWAWRNTLREMGYSDMASLRLVWRLLPFFLVNPSIPKNTLVIENVATFPRYRRQGVIHELLQAAIQQGRKENYPRMQVACLIGNKPAQKAYEKAGFKVQNEYRHKWFKKTFGNPGMMRLALEL